MARILLCLLCDNLQTLELSADRSRSLLPRAGESGENHMIFRRRIIEEWALHRQDIIFGTHSRLERTLINLEQQLPLPDERAFLAILLEQITRHMRSD